MKKLAIFPMVVLLLSIFTPMVYAGDLYKYLQFDSTDDYVLVTHDSSLNVGSGDFTIEFWFKAPLAEGANRYFLVKIDYDNAPWITIEHTIGDIIEIYLADADFFTEVTLAFDATTYFDDDWHHFFCTKNATYLALWIDDVPKGTPQGTSLIGSLDTTENLFVGQSSNGFKYYRGGLDEIRLYTRELSAAERTYSFANKEPQSQTDLEMWLRFNEGTGDTAYDETANDNDGTLMPNYGASNAPVWVDETPTTAGEEAAGKMEDAAQVAAAIMVLFVIIWAFSVTEGEGKLSDILGYLILIAVILLIAGVVGGIG